MHKMLYDNAMKAIDKIFPDTSVPKEKTAESLRELIAEIEGMLESIED